MSRRSDAHWERYGKEDPYYGVWVSGRFHASNLSVEAKEEFFASGQQYIDFVKDAIRQHIDIEFAPSVALDFGCGVGRLTIPLAQSFPKVIAVDVSPSMLQELKRNLKLRGLENVYAINADDTLSGIKETYDLVISYNVFQHIGVHRGEFILRRLLDRLETGGVGALHFTYHRKASKARYAVHWTRKHLPFVNNLVNVVQGKPIDQPLMQWNNYNLNRIQLILEEGGCGSVYIRPTGIDVNGHFGVILFFQKVRLEPILLRE